MRNRKQTHETENRKQKIKSGKAVFLFPFSVSPFPFPFFFLSEPQNPRLPALTATISGVSRTEAQAKI
jgi:hypothetical protein